MPDLLEPAAVAWWRLRASLSRSPVVERPFQYGSSRGLFERLARLERSQWWPRERLDAHRRAERARVAREALRRVPAYRERYAAAGVREPDLAEAAAFAALPTLDKTDLQKQAEAFVHPDVPESDRTYVTTGGTTGAPVGLWHDRTVEAWEEAFVWRHWRWHGVRFLDRAAICRGTRPSSGEAIGVEPRAGLVLSGFDLGARTAGAYVAALRRHRPRFLRAYPSTAALLARQMLETGEPPPAGLRAVFTSSEILLAHQRTTIETAFGCPVADLYGHAERAVAAGECPAGRLHVFVEYGELEILDDAGRPCAPGTEGEIVATGFHNRAFPLIRYRTGDLATRDDAPCPCGRALPVIRLATGRAQDFILTPEGARVTVAALNFHSPVFDGIERFRFVQRSAGRVDFEYAPLDPGAAVDEATIETELRRKLGPQLAIHYIRKERIETTRSGKHRFIVPLGAASGQAT